MHAAHRGFKIINHDGGRAKTALFDALFCVFTLVQPVSSAGAEPTAKAVTGDISACATVQKRQTILQQLAAAQQQVRDLTAKLAVADGKNDSLTADLTAAQAQLEILRAQLAAITSTTQPSGLLGINDRARNISTCCDTFLACASWRIRDRRGESTTVRMFIGVIA